MRRIRALLTGGMAALVAVLAVPAGTASAEPPAPAAAPVASAALATWFSGVLQPGAMQSNWKWKAGSDAVYEVAFSPSGATAAAPCQFESTRSWYTQETNGDRYFRWTVKNVGTIACGADVILTYRLKTASFASPGVNAGATWPKTWTIDPAKPVYLAGLWTAGATTGAACSMEVNRIWYERTFNDVVLHVVVKNIGTVTCTTTLMLANQATGGSLMTAMITTTTPYSTFWKNANPVTSAFWMAVSPDSGFCALELTRQFYQQRLTDTVLRRDIGITVKNVGSNACSGTVKWAVV